MGEGGSMQTTVSSFSSNCSPLPPHPTPNTMEQYNHTVTETRKKRFIKKKTTITSKIVSSIVQVLFWGVFLAFLYSIYFVVKLFLD
jgi:hypothetical protein